MKPKAEIFYSKILLFGEYSVICDSMGLSIPYTHFKGELSFINEDKYTDLDFALKSNQMLKDFFKHLSGLEENNKLEVNLFLDKFRKDIKRGLYFESSIPQGFGIGSSGALVAALYDKYAVDKIPNDRNLSNEEILKLKSIFAQLESYFHGVSSGLDPLNCYMRYPLLIKGKEEIQTVGIPRNKHDKNGAIFLINTGNPGKTEPLVKLFMERCSEQKYMKLIKQELIPITESCIKSLVKGETSEFFNNLESLSRFFFNHLSPMIPETFKEIWKKGLESKDYYLKLCGSGGGGFLLGFTQDFEKTRDTFNKMNIELIPVYRNRR